jgi:hypothetical protein
LVYNTKSVLVKNSIWIDLGRVVGGGTNLSILQFQKLQTSAIQRIRFPCDSSIAAHIDATEKAIGNPHQSSHHPPQPQRVTGGHLDNQHTVPAGAALPS